MSLARKRASNENIIPRLEGVDSWSLDSKSIARSATFEECADCRNALQGDQVDKPCESMENRHSRCISDLWPTEIGNFTTSYLCPVVRILAVSGNVNMVNFHLHVAKNVVVVLYSVRSRRQASSKRWRLPPSPLQRHS